MDKDFEKWYQENQDKSSLQQLYKYVKNADPDYKVCFKDWAKKYYINTVIE